jgi:hypothetical protein
MRVEVNIFPPLATGSFVHRDASISFELEGGAVLSLDPASQQGRRRGSRDAAKARVTRKTNINPPFGWHVSRIFP